MKSKIKTDTKFFDNASRNFKMRAQGELLGAALDGINEFRKACLDMHPSCPIKSGSLYNAHKTSSHREGASTFVGRLSVTGVPYAASQHEGVSRWGTAYKNYTRPGSGSHWISSKILRFLRIYGGILSFRLGHTLRHFK
jgi:hypothetical protein